MANVNTKKGIIGILTGGGDVPGLNPAIRGVTFRALREGYQVIGFRHGWGGLIEMVRDKSCDNSENYLVLTEEIVKGQFDSVELGPLKGNQGDQNYDLAATVDVQKYNAVVIYCERFHAVFGLARLEPF